MNHFFPIESLEVDGHIIPSSILDAIQPGDFAIHESKITVRLIVRKSFSITYKGGVVGVDD